MRTRAAGISPAKMAMADMETMDTSAGTGSMKKVKGMRRDAARVALSPGIEPTNKAVKGADADDQQDLRRQEKTEALEYEFHILTILTSRLAGEP